MRIECRLVKVFQESYPTIEITESRGGVLSERPHSA